MAYLEKAPLNYNVSRARHESDQHNNTSERPIHPLHSLQKLFHLISTTLHGLDEVPSKRPRAHTSTASHVQKPLENYSKHDNKNESASFDNHQQHYSCCCCCNELDRELYEYATSFDDVEQILCSSESHQETQSIASSQSIVSSSLKPNTTLSAFSSSISLTNLQFKLIALDHEHGIELYSSPIANFPIYLMCGYAMMPCSSINFLHYLSTEVRPQWDRYTRSCRVIRTIPAPLENTEWRHRARQHQMSCALATSHTTLPQMHLHHNNDTNVSNETITFCSNRTKQTNAKWSSANRESHEILLQPGQRRVSVQHLCISSPVFMVQDREFELIVGEEVKKDGTTYIKAFSPPLGYAVPLDPLQRKYVRGIAYLTAAIAKPLLINSADQLPAGLRDAALSPSSVSSVHKTPKSVEKSVLQEQEEEEEVNYSTRESTNVKEANTYSNHSFCLVGYVGLVHPMGLVPPVITNMVISAQLSSLRRLQEFILNNPLHKVVNDNIKSKTHEKNSSKKYS